MSKIKIKIFKFSVFLMLFGWVGEIQVIVFKQMRRSKMCFYVRVYIISLGKYQDGYVSEELVENLEVNNYSC